MPLSAILFFTVTNLLNYLDRYLAAALLPSIKAQFLLSDQMAAIAVSAFVVGYVIFSPIFGYLGDRYSRPVLMASGVLLWSLATLLTAFAPNVTVLMIARVLVGVGEASFGTIAPGYIKDRIRNPVQVNSALSILFSAIPVGSALGYVTGGIIADYYSWQMAFVAGAIPGFACGTVLFFFSEVDKRELPKSGAIGGLRELGSIGILRFAIGGYILNSLALNGIAGFVTTHGQHMGFSLKEIGIYFGAILVIAGGGGTLGGGRLASHYARLSRSPVRSMLGFAGITAILSAPFVFGAFTVGDRNGFLALCLVGELLVFAGVAPINSIIVLSCPSALVTLAQGVTIFSLNLFGSLPGPIIVGAISDNLSLKLGLQLMGAVLLLSGLVWTSGSRRSNLGIMESR